MSPIFSRIVCFRPGRETMLPFALVKLQGEYEALGMFLVKMPVLVEEGRGGTHFECQRSTESSLISVLQIVGAGGSDFVEGMQLLSDVEVRAS